MVQWCIKGLSLDDDAAAEQIMTDQRGLLCQWWLNSTTFPPLEEIPAKLTRENLLRHVNQFTGIDPSTGEPFNEASPFISLCWPPTRYTLPGARPFTLAASSVPQM